jgi:hypothetical protein
LTLVVLAGPFLLLVQDMLRWSWLVVLLYLDEPTETSKFAHVSILYHFLFGASGQRRVGCIDWPTSMNQARQRAVKSIRDFRTQQQQRQYHQYISIFEMRPSERDKGNDNSAGFLSSAAMLRGSSRAAEQRDSWRLRAQHAALFLHYVNTVFIGRTHDRFFRREQLEDDWWDTKVQPLLDSAGGSGEPSLRSIFPRLVWVSTDTFRVEHVLIATIVCTSFMTSFATLCFPFLWTAQHGVQNLQLLQRITAAAALFFSVCAVLATPVYVRAQLTYLFCRNHLLDLACGYSYGVPKDALSTVALSRMVDSYSSVPLEALCGGVVKPAVIPEPAMRHVTRFLTAAHCGLFGIDGPELRELTHAYAAAVRHDGDGEEVTTLVGAGAVGINYGTADT